METEVRTDVKYYSAVKAAEEAGVAHQTILNHINKGTLKATVTSETAGGTAKSYRISEDDLLDWIEHRSTKTIREASKGFVEKKLSSMDEREISDHFAMLIFSIKQEAYNAGIEEGKRQMRLQIKEALK